MLYVVQHVEPTPDPQPRTMSTSPTQVGPPRLNKTQRLLHRFYEPLYIMWNLGACAKPTQRDQQWRDVLDALSWFGDYKHGGQTVVAVAAQQCSNGATFWICGRHERSAQHISAVLAEVMSAVGSTTEEAFTVCRDRITSASIVLSSNKVRSYHQSLLYFLEKALMRAVQPGTKGMFYYGP